MREGLECQPAALAVSSFLSGTVTRGGNNGDTRQPAGLSQSTEDAQSKAHVRHRLRPARPEHKHPLVVDGRDMNQTPEI